MQHEIECHQKEETFNDCETCGKSFLNLKTLLAHRRTAHNSIEKPFIVPTVQCDKCNDNFMNDTFLEKHKIFAHKCVKCEKTFKTEKSLFKHNQMANCASDMLKNKKGLDLLHKCEKCEKTFKDQDEFQLHLS